MEVKTISIQSYANVAKTFAKTIEEDTQMGAYIIVGNRMYFNGLEISSTMDSSIAKIFVNDLHSFLYEELFKRMYRL